jgi:ribosomal-protein-alanine N-acetyltransferase
MLTARLLLRAWRDQDRAPLARMNADGRAMEFFPSTLPREESDGLADRAERHFREHGFGWWAVELRETGEFIGMTGLSIPEFQAHFMPAVEIGWRLAPEAWGRGLATEAARAALDYGFDTLHLDEIVAMTVPANARSRRVMEKLRMTRDPRDDFDHPNLDAGHPLRRHVLYRLRRASHLPPPAATM